MHKLPDLPYAYDALEPFIDAQTMQIHHTKHHQTYIDKLNDALKDQPDLQNKPLEELLCNLDSIPDEIRAAVGNNGGGHWNHSFFWTLMCPALPDNTPSGVLIKVVKAKFGDFETFKKEFSAAAVGRFGSGWAWLIKNSSGELKIISTPNQDNPLTEKSGIPILGLDVWEHSYYLKYQNRRSEYVDNWWNIVNWSKVEKNFQESV